MLTLRSIIRYLFAVGSACLIVAWLIPPATLAQSFPTRTPTPTFAPPTDTPVPQPTNTPAPQPTNTPVPQPTNTPAPQPSNTPIPQPTDTPEPDTTPTPTLQATNTPLSDSDTPSDVESTPTSTRIPECAFPPIATVVLDDAFLYAGPGIEYAAVRPVEAGANFAVTGRYGFGAWWQLAASGDLLLWIADSNVEVIGDLARVAIVDAPPLDGTTPTPGAPWTPPVNSACPTATPAATADDDVVAAATTDATPTTDADSDIVEPTATEVAASVAEPTVRPEPTPEPTPTELPLDAEAQAADTTWMLYVSGGLILAAGGAFAVSYFRRRG